MFDQKKTQEKSLEINQYKNIFDNTSSPFSKNKSIQNADSSKENCDSNRQYLISDNSQSATTRLSRFLKPRFSFWFTLVVVALPVESTTSP